MTPEPSVRRRRNIPESSRGTPPEISDTRSKPLKSKMPGQLAALRLLAYVMLVVIACDLAKGFYDLLASPTNATDVKQRWAEQRYVFNHQNPFDVLQASAVFPGYGSRPWSPRDSSVIPEVGVPAGTTYPPWSYFFGNSLYWPPLAWIRVYFALIEAAALLYLFKYGYAAGRRSGSHNVGLIIGLSAVSISSVTTTISLGQFGLLAVAALAASESLTYQRRPVLAGFPLAFALCKPNIAALFVIPFVLRLTMREHRRAATFTLLTAAATTVLASLVTGWQTHTNPIEMTLQWLAIAKFLLVEPFGFIASLEGAGLSQAAASNVALIGSLSAAIILITLWRRSELLLQFAVACLAGRVWSYHRMYDNVMLAFLLVGLARLWLIGRNRQALPAYLLVCISLWIPVHFVGNAVADAQRLAWLYGLFVLLWQSRSDDAIDISNGPSSVAMSV